jgi:hypothetical protein
MAEPFCISSGRTKSDTLLGASSPRLPAGSCALSPQSHESRRAVPKRVHQPPVDYSGRNLNERAPLSETILPPPATAPSPGITRIWGNQRTTTKVYSNPPPPASHRLPIDGRILLSPAKFSLFDVRPPDHLARILHSFCHRYGHLSANGFRDGDGCWICGLIQNRPSEEGFCDRADREKTAGSGNPHDLAGLPAEHSGGGFASSPDVSACRFGPRVVNSLHAGCRVECATSGLGDRKRARFSAKSAEQVRPAAAITSP